MARVASLADCVAYHAAVRPAAPALVANSMVTSYVQLAGMVSAAYTRLCELDLPHQCVLSVHAKKTPQTIALITACMRAGLQVFLPPTDLGVTALGRLLRRAGVKAALSATPHTGARVPGIPMYEIDCAVRDSDQVELGRQLTAHRPPAPEDISLLFSTSGSTGTPKVVPLPAAALDSFTEWAASRFEIGPGVTVLSYAPLVFDLSLLDVWASLRAGAAVALVDQQRATQGRHLAELMWACPVQVVQSVPMFFRLLAEGWRQLQFPHVRHVIVTGDKMPARLLPALPRLFPNARMYNVYGCTETNDSFLHEVGAEFWATCDGGTELPIGRPLPGVDALIVAGDGTVIEGPGTGELLVRTPFQTPGYLRMLVGAEAADDAQRFVRRDRHGDFFRSGDYVQRDAEGVFTLLGRRDFQIKVRGTRVNLQEVEQTILRHDRVREAAVIGVPDALAGSRIHAVVRGDRPGALNSLVVREHCRLTLPRAAIPSAIEVVDTPLPTTPTGKLDRRAISQVILEGSKEWTTHFRSRISS